MSYLYCHDCEQAFNLSDARNIVMEERVVVDLGSQGIKSIIPIACPGCESWANVVIVDDE